MGLTSKIIGFLLLVAAINIVLISFFVYKINLADYVINPLLAAVGTVIPINNSLKYYMGVGLLVAIIVGLILAAEYRGKH